MLMLHVLQLMERRGQIKISRASGITLLYIILTFAQNDGKFLKNLLQSNPHKTITEKNENPNSLKHRLFKESFSPNKISTRKNGSP